MDIRAPRRGFRVGALSPVARLLVLVVLGVLAVVPLVAGARAVAGGWQPTGDTAVIGLRASDAWTADAPLLGHPTTADRATGTRSSNPGPAEYWVLGVTVRGFGARYGLALGAALVNAASLVGIGWLAHRRGGVELFTLVLVAVVGLVLSLGGSSLWDPFNSEIATYPMLLTLLAAWSVAQGDLRVAPVLAAAGTFAVQVHVAAAAFVGPLVVVAAATVVVVARRHPGALRRERMPLAAAAAITAVAWAPVVAHELGSRPSNIGALWQTSAADRPRIGLVFVVERLVRAIAPVPAFLRRSGFLDDAAWPLVLVAAAALGGAGFVAVWSRRHWGRTSLPWLVLLTGVGALSACLLASRQPPLVGFRADGARWLWVVSLATWVALGWAAVARVPDRYAARAREIAPFLAGAAALALGVGVLVDHRLAEVRDGRLMPTVARTASATIEELDPATYHVQTEGDQALLTVGPGVAYLLEDAGFRVLVDDNAFGRAFGESRTRSADGAPTIRISSVDGATPAGDERMVAVVPGDAAHDVPTIRVFVDR